MTQNEPPRHRPRHRVASTSQALPAASQFRFAEPDEHEKLPRAPKAHHKKSRNGCRTCRSRRVKCDEIRPTCGNCRRRQITCLFDIDSNETHASNDSPHSGAESTEHMYGIKPNAETLVGHPETTESRGRRRLELKLMHTYNTQTCHTLANDDNDVSFAAWIHQAPKLALENDALLSAIFSFTALHLIEVDPSNENEMRLVHHRYWHMALQEHAQELRDLNPANFDAACITSTFIRLIALVMLRDRPRSPYTPPTEWFRVTRGAMQVFAVAYPWMSTSQDSIASRLTERMPFVFDEEAKFAPSNRERLAYLSGQVGNDALEHLSAIDREAYEKTISYIGGICMAMDVEGSTPDMCRRLILLPYLVPARFAELLQAQQPRALVIVGHQFALLSQYRKFWWIGTAGAREVRALAAALLPEWQSLMAWPLSIIDHEVSETHFGQHS